MQSELLYCNVYLEYEALIGSGAIAFKAYNGMNLKVRQSGDKTRAASDFRPVPRGATRTRRR